MESHPQNPEFRNNPENFTHVSVHIFRVNMVKPFYKCPIIISY